MSKKVVVPKIGKSYTSTDPNDFVFNSDYNTFKIILAGTLNITLLASTTNQTFTVAHGLNFVPLMNAFAKESGFAQVFVPNEINIEIYGPKAGVISTEVRFNYVSADSTNIIFNFDNNNAAERYVKIRYFALEQV